MSVASPEFTAIGTTVRVIAAEESTLQSATALAAGELEVLDRAASRFRGDSELSAINAAAQSSEVVAKVSPTLAWALAATLDASAQTGGLVDPTVGTALVQNGYDADIDVVQSADRAAHAVSAAAPAPGWQSLTLDRSGRWLRVPHGASIDLGSIGKAAAADHIAEQLASTLNGSFLVDLGGDIACAGPPPERGWLIGVQGDHAAGSSDTVAISRGGIATSSTTARSWSAGGTRRHHIVDPRTGEPAEVVFSQVSCVAHSCAKANAASTAAVILGELAPAWLERQGIAARLERPDGTVLTTPAWKRAQVLK